MTIGLFRRLLLTVLLFGGVYWMMRQCRKPSGSLGRRIAHAMNHSHAGLTAWGLSHVELAPTARILDIGCGGGATVRRLADAAPSGHVDGVDYSATSVSVARERNADLIAADRVAVQQASVSRLPFGDGSFDLATAVETHYYWPDLTNDLREVWRVLRPGGRFLLVAEAYRGRKLDALFQPIMRGLLRATYLTPAEHERALVAAGFADVRVTVDRGRGWICAVGSRA